MKMAEDVRPSQLVRRLTRGRSFDPAAAWDEVCSNEIEVTADPTLSFTPFEVLLAANKEIDLIQNVHASHIEMANELRARVYEEASGLDPVETAACLDLEYVADPVEIRNREMRLFKEALKNGRLSEFEKSTLEVLRATVNAGDWDLRSVKDLEQAAMAALHHVSRCVEAYPRSCVAPWALGRLSRMWLHLARRTRQQEYAKRALDALTSRVLPLKRFQHTGALLQNPSLVPGLFMSCAYVALGTRRFVGISGLRERLSPILKDLLHGYVRLGENRLLDRLGVCALISIAHRSRGRWFGWEAVQLAARYLGERDAKLDNPLSSTPPHDIARKRILDTIQGTARRMQSLGAAGGSTLRSAERWLIQIVSALTDIHGMRILDTTEIRLAQRADAFSRAGEEPLFVRNWDVAGAERAAQSTDGDLATRLRRVFTLAVVRRYQGDVVDEERCINLAMGLLPPLQDGEEPEILELRWRILFHAGMHLKARRDYRSAVRCLYDSGAAAAGAYLLHRVAQSMASLSAIYRLLRIDSQYENTRSTVRLVVGLGLLLGNPDPITMIAEIYPEAQMEPDLLRDLNRRLAVLNKRELHASRSRRGREALRRERANRLQQDAIAQCFRWVAAAAGEGSPGSKLLIAGLRTILDAGELEMNEDAIALSRTLQECIRRMIPERAFDLHRSFRSLERRLIAQERSPHSRQRLPVADLDAWKEEVKRAGSAAAPLQAARILLNIASLALKHRQADVNRRQEYERLAVAAVDAVESIRPSPTPETPWWLGTELEHTMHELKSRSLLGDRPSDVAESRRLQFERRLELLNRDGRRNSMMIRDMQLLEKDLASSMPDPGRLPLERISMVLRQLKDLNLFVVSGASRQPAPAPPADESESPDLEASTDGDLGDSELEVVSSKAPEAGAGALHSRREVVLDYFVAPVDPNGPHWTALCLASTVARERDEGIRLDPRACFVSGGPPGESPGTRSQKAEAWELGRLMVGWEALRRKPKALNSGEVDRTARSIRTHAVKLGSWLFTEPLLEWLNGVQPDHVYLCPHGLLFHIPLHALPDARGRSFCDAGFTVSILPNPHHLRILEATPDRSKLGRADSPLIADWSLPGAPALREVPHLRVHDSWKNADEAVRAVTEAGSGVFYCHGLQDPRPLRAWKSRLLLPGGARVTIRTLDKVVGDLSGCEILLLSCHAAAGKTPGGSTNIGLASTIIRRAARTVVAPLHPVRDKQAATILAAYVEARGQGQRPARAFQAALRRLREPGEETADTWVAWPSWSSFVLYGVS